MGDVWGASVDLGPYLLLAFLEGTVTAFAINTFPQLWINSVGMAFLNTETKLMAHLPLMFSKARQEMLIICYGMGTTSRSASNHQNPCSCPTP